MCHPPPRCGRLWAQPAHNDERKPCARAESGQQDDPCIQLWDQVHVHGIAGKWSYDPCVSNYGIKCMSMGVLVSGHMIPVSKYGIKCMSMGLLVSGHMIPVSRGN
jgi:hypothetical protein